MLKVGIDWSFEAGMLHIPSSWKGELTWYIVNIFSPLARHKISTRTWIPNKAEDEHSGVFV